MPTPNANYITLLERLSEKLDTADKKIIEYAQLIASLYAEQKRCQDIICHSCRENIFRANLATAPPDTVSSWISQSTSQPIAAAPVILSGPTSFVAPTPTASAGLSESTTTSTTVMSPFQDLEQVATSNVQGAAAPALPGAPSLGAQDQSSPISQSVCLHSSGAGNSDLDGLNFATSESSPHPQVTVPYSADADSAQPQPAVPPTPEKSNKANPTKRDWSVEYNPKIKQTLNLHVANTFTFAARVLCVKFSCDGKYLAMGLKNSEIHIHNMMTGSKSTLVERSAKVFYTEEAETPSEIRAVRFSVDNKCIATGGSKGLITIWEIGRRRVRATFKHKLLVRSLDLSPDGRFLVSASRDKSLCMWRVRDGSRRIIMSHGTSSFVSVAFSPDGRSVAAGNKDGLLRIWDASSGQLVAKFRIPDLGSFIMRSVAFAPDGKGIASGNNILRCWDVSSLTGRHSGLEHMIQDDTTNQLNQIWEFKGHKGSIAIVTFSSDNLWVISSSMNRNVCILDARTGSWVCTLKGHLGEIWGADFSPDGHYIVSGSQDRQVRVWRCEIVE